MIKNNNPRILLVEDEDSIREMLKLNLELEGYEVVDTINGKSALEIFENQHFDLVLSDIMLPEIDGYSITQKIRLSDLQTPIVLLTAKDQAQDKILGLKKGADDYITKPFHLEELMLRIKKLIQRTTKNSSSSTSEFTFGANYVNFSTYEARGIQSNFTLTKKEAMLLKLLIDRQNEVVSRQEILQFVWGYDVFPSTRTIDNFILSFRKYFEINPRKPQFFHSIRGIGYKFVKLEP